MVDLSSNPARCESSISTSLFRFHSLTFCQKPPRSWVSEEYEWTIEEKSPAGLVDGGSLENADGPLKSIHLQDLFLEVVHVIEEPILLDHDHYFLDD